MATLAAIERQLAKLRNQADAMSSKQGAAVKKILQQMKAAGVTVDDIVSATNGRTTQSAKAQKQPATKTALGKLPPKYRDPETGATWSGHARPPAWIKDAEDRSVFLIGKRKSAGAPRKATDAVGKKGAKSNGRARKAKYQDPASGATWSGAGRPPAWISQAPDRDAFLISQ